MEPMVEYQDDCVACGLPCTPACKYYRKVPHFFCDNCGAECDPDEIYTGPDTGADLCEECVLEEVKQGLKRPYID